MLEFNGWFFVLLGQFVVLLFVLNIILFKPLLRIFDERTRAIEGALEDARKMDEQRGDSTAALKADMTAAGNMARDKYSALRAEGLDKQKALLLDAANQAASLIEKARAEIKSEKDRCRSVMKSDIERYSNEIVDKLVKTS